MPKSRKLAMVKRESKEARSVTFTKRRQGLFNKAAEFSILCDSQIAVIVSPSRTDDHDKPKKKNKRKALSFGHSCVDSVINAFLNNCVPDVVNDRIKQRSLSLLNEINSIEEETLIDDDDQSEKSRVELGDFENSKSVEDLEKLVEGLEKLVDDTKRNPKFTCGASNCDNHDLFDHLQDMEFGFGCDDDKALVPADSNNVDDELLGILELADSNYPELKSSTTETSPELGFSDSREEDDWRSNNYEYLSFENEYDQDSHLPYIDYWPSS